MARGAAEPDNHKKQITRFIVKAAAPVLMLAAAPYLIFCGPPLAGLPDADEVTRVEITRIDDGLSKCATNAKDIELVRKAAELLRYAPFAVPREEAPAHCGDFHNARRKRNIRSGRDFRASNTKAAHES